MGAEISPNDFWGSTNQTVATPASNFSWTEAGKGISGIFSSLNSFAGGYAKSAAYGIQADYQKRISDINATIADMEYDSAIEKGEKASALYSSQIRQKVGTERASFASQGVDVNTGTAAEVQHQTEFFGAVDSQTIKNNAYTQAFGYKMQAIGATAAGQYAQIAGNLNSESSLISGGLASVGGLSKTAFDYFGTGTKKG